jgi:hypothetical protein
MKRREIHVLAFEAFVCEVNVSGYLKKTVALKCGRVIC